MGQRTRISKVCVWRGSRGIKRPRLEEQSSVILHSAFEKRNSQARLITRYRVMSLERTLVFETQKRERKPGRRTSSLPCSSTFHLCWRGQSVLSRRTEVETTYWMSKFTSITDTNRTIVSKLAKYKVISCPVLQVSALVGRSSSKRW